MRSRTLHELARRWWAGELGPSGALLDALALPAEWLFRTGVAGRNRAYERGWLDVQRAAVPVISVGNLAVGGAGKTPFAAWLVRELLRRGRRPALLHGGYAQDEPALHRRWAPEVPVIARRDRVSAAAEAVARGADVLVLDDAFQHRRLARDLDIVLVAAERWAERPRLLPRGPWREGPSSLVRAGLVVVTRRSANREVGTRVAAQVARFATARPPVQVLLAPGGWVDGRGEPAAPPGAALVVTAIAEPAAFLSNAAAAGAEITGHRFWPDHHDYTAAETAALVREAGGRAIVTTEKDWIKLARLLPPERVRVLRQELVVEAGGESLSRSLEDVLGG